MQEILELTIKSLITAICGAFVGATIVWAKGLHSKNKVYEDAVKALAHDSFYRQCRNLIGQDTMTEAELENLNFLHEAYTSLGMNGTGEELYRRCMDKRIEG